jgi:small subunit ribosomal protein S6
VTQNYETMYILRSDLSEEQVEEIVNKYRNLLTEQKAEDLQIQNRGKRRLAYPIKNYNDGIYIQFNYKGDGKQVAPLEKMMRFSDEVIRYLTILRKKDEPTVTVTQAPTPLPTPSFEPQIKRSRETIEEDDGIGAMAE